MLLNDDRAAPTNELAPPPPLAADHSLFLDFDGTLIELADRPDGVIVDPALLVLLELLAERLGGRVAIVSGRAIAQLDALLGPATGALAIAGSHGAERRTPDEGHLHPETAPGLAAAQRRFEDFAAAHGLVFEAKSFGAGLHYRAVPERGPDALAFAAAVAAEHGLIVQPGKMMAEVRMPGDKGRAVRALLDRPAFAGSTPLFFGDDVTDEDGFVAASACGGAGVLIGEPRATAARYRIESVPALRRWLGEGAERLR